MCRRQVCMQLQVPELASMHSELQDVLSSVSLPG